MLSRQLHQVQQFHGRQVNPQLQGPPRLHIVDLLASSSETELPKYDEIFPKKTSEELKEAGILLTKLLLYNFSLFFQETILLKCLTDYTCKDRFQLFRTYSSSGQIVNAPKAYNNMHFSSTKMLEKS